MTIFEKALNIIIEMQQYDTFWLAMRLEMPCSLNHGECMLLQVVCVR